MFDITCSKLSCHLRKLSSEQSSLPSLLSSDLVSDTVQELGISFRCRIFTPFLTLFAFLSQVFNDDSSCKRAVAEVNTHFLKKKNILCSFGTSSFCKAKARLPLDFFQILARKLGSNIEKVTKDSWIWKHGRVLVIDGTGFSMPETPNNLEFFQKHTSNKHNVGFPVGSLSAVFSLASGALIDAEISPSKGKGSGESSLLHGLWKSFHQGDTLLGDALYSSFWIVACALQRNLHVVTELKPRSEWRLSKRKNDQIITISKPRYKPVCLTDKEFKDLPKEITVRIVRIICAPNGFRPRQKLILTTHLNSNKVKADEIKDLYKRRWQVEINLRSIKTILGMDVLRGLSNEMVKKEVWVHLIAYNLTRLVMVLVASTAKKMPAQMSFRASAQALSVVRFILLLTGKQENVGTFLFEMVNSVEVGKHPDRYEPRAIKRRRKNFSFLNKPRKILRKRLCKKYKRKYASS